MADVGINVKMTEDISTVVPKASEAIRNMSKASEDLKQALDLSDIEPAWKAYTEKVEKLHTLQEANRREAQRDVSQQGTIRGRVIPTGIPETLVSKVGGTAAQLGRTGDVAEAGAGITGMMGGMLSALGPLGIFLGVAAAGTLAANALSKQYEAVLPSIMSLTAAFGNLEDSAKETGISFRDTRTEISGIAESLGYSLQVGLAVARTITEVAGVGRGEAVGGMKNVMGYARGFGVEPSALARYQAMGMRFGETGNVLGMAAGGLQQAGMGPGQYQEFLNATLSIFEQGISQGIIQGFGDINIAQSWIAQLGDAFRGQYGINLYNKMQGAMIGATSLSTETDVLMFRAAKGMIEGLSPAERKKMGVGFLDGFRK